MDTKLNDYIMNKKKNWEEETTIAAAVVHKQLLSTQLNERSSMIDVLV